MEPSLTPAEARVLGSLIEKQITTPEYYPLSLNALTNACNQRSNRYPVMDLDEQAVREALHSLRDNDFAGQARGSESRVAKYEHHLQERFNLRRGEIALLCVLLLRGAQTPGELRGRSERLHTFADLDEVAGVLNRLIERDPPLARVLPRERGAKEVRYIELLSLQVDGAGEPREDTENSRQEASLAMRDAVTPGEANAGDQDARQEQAERLDRLEEELRALSTRITQLEQKLGPLLG